MWYILLTMIFLHVVDDYYLQGILASMKQISWWKYQTGFNSFYSLDYLVALAMHAFSWAFMIMLPFYKIAISGNLLFLSLFIFNAFIHAVTDDLKANAKKLNLIMDQSIHIAQIIFTFYMLTNFVK